MDANNFLQSIRNRFYRGYFWLRGNNLSSPHLIHPSVRVQRSTIFGSVEIAKNCIIKESFIQVKEAEFGRNTSLWGPGISIHAIINPIFVGSFCSFAKNVSIQEYNHDIDRLSGYFIEANYFDGEMTKEVVSKGRVLIGNDVWLASNVVVTSGVTIGDGAVIGANSVVLDDIPPYAIAAGCPAKVVRYRFSPEIVDTLLNIKWWGWDDEKLWANKELFSGRLTMDRLGAIKG